MQGQLFTDKTIALKLPDAELSYTTDFIEGQQAVFEQLQQSIDWCQEEIKLYGKTMPVPRLTAWFGDCGKDYAYSGIQHRAQAWTSPLLRLKTQLEDHLGSSFNSVLINYYRDGNDSVGWHADDEPELGPCPLIASLSVGATRRFSLRHSGEPDLPIRHLELAGGSLLVMAGQTQHHWQHRLAKTADSIAGRINLTFRSIIS